MKITVFGTGDVGLRQAACLAEVRHSVFCIDINAQRIESLNQGHSPIFEPGLSELLVKNLVSKRLMFSTDGAFGGNFADIIFNAVGTPPAADRVLFDDRNLFDPAHLKAAGLGYYAIGRGRTSQA
ncbi:hypothetical protein FQ187_29655 [Pseudomonas sp. ANT_J28]|nr:hypothetical protein FQ187_29655 [Pseudomonas sp. ANT_J28]